MPYDDIVLEAEDKMEKAVAVLAEELRGVRTGRATAGLVDQLKIEAYGAPTPLKSLASITVPEPRMIMVKSRSELFAEVEPHLMSEIDILRP